jgi:uncharacterized protein
MDKARHTMVVRFYAGELSITLATTPKGRQFHLLNSPYFLVSHIEPYLGWLTKHIPPPCNLIDK